MAPLVCKEQNYTHIYTVAFGIYFRCETELQRTCLISLSLSAYLGGGDNRVGTLHGKMHEIMDVPLSLTLC